MDSTRVLFKTLHVNKGNMHQVMSNLYWDDLGDVQACRTEAQVLIIEHKAGR